MSKGGDIADYVSNQDPTQYLIWKHKVEKGEINWTRSRYRCIAKYADGTACVVSQDERGYFVYGPYFAWRAG